MPFFVEGTKTLAYELWEQLGFKAPDNVVTPLGYGSNVLGCLRGFDELERAARSTRVPRVFGVQAENCAPYHAAWKAGADTLVPTEIKPTIAEGIASSKPTRVKEVLNGVRESGGAIVAVSEARNRRGAARARAQRALRRADVRGRRGGPDAALDSGAIKPDETTVLVLTGSGLKASERIGELLNLRARER